MIKDWDIERKLDKWTKEVCEASLQKDKELVQTPISARGGRGSIKRYGRADWGF